MYFLSYRQMQIKWVYTHLLSQAWKFLFYNLTSFFSALFIHIFTSEIFLLFHHKKMNSKETRWCRLNTWKFYAVAWEKSHVMCLFILLMQLSNWWKLNLISSPMLSEQKPQNFHEWYGHVMITLKVSFSWLILTVFGDG